MYTRSAARILVIAAMGWLSTFVGISRAGARPPAPSATEAAAAGGVVHNVKAFGAIGDGATKDTQALQAAIDAAERAGGGTVYFPPGTYLSGTLFLKSNVTLHLEAGATLLGSTDIKDYASHRSLIHAEDVRNIAITGRGTIDGQGGGAVEGSQRESESEDALQAARARGKILDFVRCHNVRIEAVTLRNSPSWMQHYFECENVVIDGVSVHNHCNHYNDGMDIDNCRDVRISNCRITSGDDAIVLKSRSERFCENVTITNCIVSSHSNGIKLGTESHGGFRDIAISNCVVVPVDPKERFGNGAQQGLAGIILATVDGALLEQVAVSNITIRGTIAPIFIRLGNRGRKWRPDMDTPPVGTLRDVVISNIVATGASSVGCGIVGLPGHRIEDLTLSDVSITFGAPDEFVNYKNVEPGGTLEDVQREIPELPDAYPECIMFRKLPAYGFYARHVDGLTLRNVRVSWTERDQRPALFCEDVHNLSVDALHARSARNAAPVVVLNDVRTALIQGCVATTDTNTFLRLQGKTDQVRVLANDLSRAIKPFNLAENVPTTALYEAANAIGR